MIIDCDQCVMQHTSACDDCIVTVLLAGSGPVELAGAESHALHNLAEVGLVAPLRLVPRSMHAPDRPAPDRPAPDEPSPHEPSPHEPSPHERAAAG